MHLKLLDAFQFFFLAFLLPYEVVKYLPQIRSFHQLLSVCSILITRVNFFIRNIWRLFRCSLIRSLLHTDTRLLLLVLVDFQLQVERFTDEFKLVFSPWFQSRPCIFEVLKSKPIAWINLLDDLLTKLVGHLPGLGCDCILDYLFVREFADVQTCSSWQ